MNPARHPFWSVLFMAVLALRPGVRLLAAETAVPAPEISLSLRAIADESVDQGEPIRVTVRLDAPAGTSDEIEIAPASGAWSDAISVELASARGGPVLARAQVVGTPETLHAILSATKVAGGLWRFSTESMGRIAPGDYVVRARLVIRSGRGWTGEVVSDDIPIQVTLVSDSPDRVARRTINRAHEALLDGRIEEAAATIDAMLERMPDDESLLTVRADIAQRAGNSRAALVCLNRFLRRRDGSGDGPPPVELQELRTQIMNALFSGDALAPDPPAWSWPPAAVLVGSMDEDRAPPEPAAAINTAVSTTTETRATAPAPSTGNPSAQEAPHPMIAPAIFSSGAGAKVPAAELNEATILADTAGQWASSARASSEYGAPRYGAVQATGAPDIPLGLAGDNPEAWCPAEKNAGTAWLELAFAKPVHATEVRVRQNNAPGAISRIEVVDLDGVTHLWWEGVDPFVAPRVREIAWFAVRVPRTEYLVATVRITLNLAAVPDWKQIDAVQLVGAAP